MQCSSENNKWGEVLTLRFFYPHLFICEYFSRIEEMHNGCAPGCGGPEACENEGHRLLPPERWDVFLLSDTLHSELSPTTNLCRFAISSLLFNSSTCVLSAWKVSITKLYYFCPEAYISIPCFCLQRWQASPPTSWHDGWSQSFGEQGRLWVKPAQNVLYCTGK